MHRGEVGIEAEGSERDVVREADGRIDPQTAAMQEALADRCEGMCIVHASASLVRGTGGHSILVI